jgi:hypothetical protein
LKESNRNFDDRQLTGAEFLDVAKALETVWAKGLLYKLTVLNFPSYIVKTIHSYLDCRTFQTSIQSAISTCRGMRAGLAQGGLVSPVLSSLYVNDIPTPSRHVELPQYAEKTALVATSRNPSLLIGYLDAYLGRLECWLHDWRIAIKVPKSTALFFVKTARHVEIPKAVQFLGEPIQWVDTELYHGVTLDTQLT